jgi:hypothetical protein
VSQVVPDFIPFLRTEAHEGSLTVHKPQTLWVEWALPPSGSDFYYRDRQARRCSFIPNAEKEMDPASHPTLPNRRLDPHSPIGLALRICVIDVP